MTKEQKILTVAAILLGTIGIVIVGKETSWWVALGIFLMLWGNNISEYGRRK